MEFFNVYIIIAIVFGGVYGYLYMKPYYQAYQGDKRLPTARQRLMVAGKLGIAYSIAWAVSSVLMPLVIAEALYKSIKKTRTSK
jgi:hypothetical protein